MKINTILSNEKAKQHPNNPETFQNVLLENGAEFPATFSQNLHRIINAGQQKGGMLEYCMFW